MQEWMIAMLVIGVLLLLRDMAKTIFSEMKKSAAALDYDRHPQKEKMQRYAESFQKLANSFYGMPCRKDYLSSSELKDLIEEAKEEVCRKCSLNQVCWTQHYPQTYQRLYGLLRNAVPEGLSFQFRAGRAGGGGQGVSVPQMPSEPGVLETTFRPVLPEVLRSSPDYGRGRRGKAEKGKGRFKWDLRQSGKTGAGAAKAYGQRTAESDME